MITYKAAAQCNQYFIAGMAIKSPLFPQKNCIDTYW